MKSPIILDEFTDMDPTRDPGYTAMKNALHRMRNGTDQFATQAAQILTMNTSQRKAFYRRMKNGMNTPFINEVRMQTLVMRLGG